MCEVLYHSTMGKTMKASALTWKDFSTAIFIAVSTSVIPLVPPLHVPACSQVPPLSVLTPQYPDRERFDVRAVWLDGYRIFHIAAPSVVDNQATPKNLPLPVDTRKIEIERRLYQIVHKGLDPETLQVTYKFLKGFPVIYVKDGKQLSEQQLMTITDLDAKLVEGDAQARAEELTEIIKNALIRAYQERQIQFLFKQIAQAGGITLAAVALSWGIRRLQRRTKAQREALLVEDESTELEILRVTASPDDPQPVPTLASIQHQMDLQQKLELNDIQRRLLQVGQVVIWGSAIALNLGLFPYTRGLQYFIVSKPLKLLSVGLMTYVGVRMSRVSIDRFFVALDSEKTIPSSRVSKRKALRVSTFSRVLKSIATLTGTGIGTLVALLILGVDVVPLLAGLGAFALAISLASQHVVRDIINGLLILVEDQYAVGDVIVVGNLGGFVEYMNLRITQLRNDEGRLISIPNGTISVVENLSKEWSRVDFTIDIAYDADLEKALSVIRQIAEQLYSEREWKKRILETPEILGVDEIDHAGILIRVWFKVKPLEQWNVAREFRRRLKLAFDRTGIRVGVPQQSLLYGSSLALAEAQQEGNRDSVQPTAQP